MIKSACSELVGMKRVKDLYQRQKTLNDALSVIFRYKKVVGMSRIIMIIIIIIKMSIVIMITYIACCDTVALKKRAYNNSAISFLRLVVYRDLFGPTRPAQFLLTSNSLKFQ